jgi:hypothetical protein
MKTKRFVVALLSFLMASGIAIAAVSAVWTPSLPGVPVTLGITNTTAWTFPWQVALSGIGSGFDVSDGSYTGWCVDTEHGIDRTQTYLVNLYSSYDPALPAAIAGVDWNRINYVLNNKDSGTADDIQAVLWYIVSGDWLIDAAWGYTHTATADAILAAAQSSGGTYEPGEGDILAVICLPEGSEETRAQMLVIELSVPTLEPGYTPGFWKHNIGVCLGYKPGHFSAFNDGTKLSCTLLESYTSAAGYTLEEAWIALNAKGNKNGEAAIRADCANAFNAAAGYGPFED